jgi:hypothetical protein
MGCAEAATVVGEIPAREGATGARKSTNITLSSKPRSPCPWSSMSMQSHFCAGSKNIDPAVGSPVDIVAGIVPVPTAALLAAAPGCPRGLYGRPRSSQVPTRMRIAPLAGALEYFTAFVSPFIMICRTRVSSVRTCRSESRVTVPTNNESYQSKAKRIKSNQVESNQIKSNQIKSNACSQTARRAPTRGRSRPLRHRWAQ